MANIVHSNYRDEWETPPEFFKRLNDIFVFGTDLFASDSNALCPHYRTKRGWSSLSTDWGKMWRWANPPYGRGLGDHVHDVRSDYILFGRRTVMLLPSNTDTAWFHGHVLPVAHIVYIRGRLQFLLDGERPRNSKGRLTGNTGGNILAIFGPNLLQTNSISARA